MATREVHLGALGAVFLTLNAPEAELIGTEAGLLDQVWATEDLGTKLHFLLGQTVIYTNRSFIKCILAIWLEAQYLSKKFHFSGEPGSSGKFQA